MATKTTTKKSGKSKAEESAEKILAPLEEMLERGDLPPWAKPWDAAKCLHVGAGDRPYQGFNQMLTTVVAGIRGYQSRRWWTFKAIKAAGGSVQKGEKGTAVVLYKKWSREVEQENGETETVGGMLMRHYTVFNLDQTDLPQDVKTPAVDEDGEPFDPIAAAEEIIAAGKGTGRWAKTFHGFDAAYYTPSRDTVSMPDPATFTSPALYYSTLFHEQGHATGHADRLARRGVMEATRFGTIRYGLEEIVAETCAAILCGVAGLEAITIQNTAAYCQNWLQVIRADRQAFIRMAGHGVKAAQYLLGEDVTYKAADEKATEEMVAA
jgi:antirestriction protein ArdC